MTRREVMRRHAAFEETRLLIVDFDITELSRQEAQELMEIHLRRSDRYLEALGTKQGKRTVADPAAARELVLEGKEIIESIREGMSD